MFEDVTTHVAIADSTDLAYEHAFDRHWSDVFRFALAWTNDWGAAEDLARTRSSGSGTTATSSTGSDRCCRGSS